MKSSGCLFCKIAVGELAAAIVEVDEYAVAFRDVNPQAPIHILIIPKKHIATLDETVPEDRELLGHLLLMGRTVAKSQDLHAGYRLVLNNGAEAGQSIFHIHLHLLGGRPLRWPPG